MKNELTFLVLGMILVVIGAFLKISHNQLGQYVLILGLVIEAYILASMVIKSLRK